MHSHATETFVLALLRDYVTDTKTIEALRYVIDHAARASTNEIIEKMAFAHANGLGVTPGYVSDKTAYIALHYQQKTREANEDATSDLAEQLWELENKHEQLEFFVLLLERKQQEVIRLRYFEGKDKKAVCEKIRIAPRTYDKYRREAIDRLCELYEITSGRKTGG